MIYFPLQLSVTEDLTINFLVWNWHIIYPTSHHDELQLYRRKENHFFFFCETIQSSPASEG